MAGAALQRAIEDACDGLVLISETDSAIKPVLVRESDASKIEDALPVLAGSDKNKITKRTAEDFFARLILEREWHGEGEIATARRFRILKDLLFANLEELAQYRSGNIRITIFVIGRDAEGNFAGIRTESVET